MKTRLPNIIVVLLLTACLPFAVIGAKKDPNRFVDNGDGTISDTQTGLMWEKKSSGDGVQNPSNPSDVDNVYTWTDISDGDLSNRDGTAFQLSESCIDPSFGPTAPARYWSSSSNFGGPGPGFAWGVDFEDGGSGLNSKNSELPVRAVRTER